MKKYIITWTISYLIQIICPCNQPQYDKFGRIINQGITYDVLCTKMIYEDKQTIFSNVDEALLFYGELDSVQQTENKWYASANQLANIKIDSIISIK